MPTGSTDEAMALLRAIRREQIATAQGIAIELLLRRGADGVTNSREVWAVMARRGILEPEVKDHWLGAIFRDERFEWTGRWAIPELPEGTAIHAQRPVKVWRLARGMMLREAG
jgi:hypothetical protein